VKGIEPRQILSRVWTPSFYVDGEGNTRYPEVVGSTGVRDHSMYPRFVEGNPGDPRRVGKEYEVTVQEYFVQDAAIPSLEVRSSHYSEEAE
jgi:hypothetical protein